MKKSLYINSQGITLWKNEFGECFPHVNTGSGNRCDNAIREAVCLGLPIDDRRNEATIRNG